MSEELFDPDKYVWDYPIWTVVNRETHRQKGLPDSLVSLKLTTGPNYFLQFADEDLVQRFIDGAKWDACEAVAISDAQQFLPLLREMPSLGFTHVALDLPPLSDNLRPRWGPIPIAEAIRMLEGTR